MDTEGAERKDSYTTYLLNHKDASCPTGEINIPLLSYTDGYDLEDYSEFYPERETALYMGTESFATWTVEVAEAGYYNLYLEYLTVPSRGVAVERAVEINGKSPFSDAGNLTFQRIWVDGGEVRIDNQGNEIRPVQTELYEWQAAYCSDDMGYITEPYLFYFHEGQNSITLRAINEPMILGSFLILGVCEEMSYAEYHSAVLGTNNGETETVEGLSYLQMIQGETAVRRSDSSLYAKYDRSSDTTKPYSITTTVLNYIGGDAWKASGQWIEWEFEVPEDGYYNITIKGRQNYARGSVTSRKLLIDRSVPFQEMNEIRFSYSNQWQMITLSEAEDKPYEFYLTKGIHTLRLEATLGSTGEVLEELEDSTYRLNQIYRQLLIYTGTNPDKYRDYNIDNLYPEVIEAMSLESKRLYKIVDDSVAYTGQKADNIAAAQTLAQQLERFVEKPNRITTEFTTFKDNITALGTAILNMSESKLDIDYLIVTGTDISPEPDRSNLFSRAAHEIRSFVASFFIDYDAVGDIYEDTEQVVNVWVLTGRDQGTILKSMIDDTFTPQTGVKVNVDIVAGDALLSAVVAGRGPNIVLSVGADQPVNYALRNSVEDLTQFVELPEVLSAYTESSYQQFLLNGGVSRLVMMNRRHGTLHLHTTSIPLRYRAMRTMSVGSQASIIISAISNR